MGRQPNGRSQTHIELDELCTIHQRVTAAESLRVPGIAVTGHAQAAGPTGGDWWSCHALPDGRVLVAVGDVTGHDTAAALIAARARGVVAGVVRAIGAQATPARVMAILDDALADLGDTGREMTCCVQILDPMLGRLDLASAGHPFPFIRHASGKLDVVVARGAPLASAAPAAGIARADLVPGDLILLSTDGLIDRAGRDGQRFGERRLRRLLIDHTQEPTTNVYRLRADILAALRGFAAATAADDDLTMVVCEFRAFVEDGAEVSVVPAAPAAAVDPDADISAAIDAALDVLECQDTTKTPLWPGPP